MLQQSQQSLPFVASSPIPRRRCTVVVFVVHISSLHSFILLCLFGWATSSFMIPPSPPNELPWPTWWVAIFVREWCLRLCIQEWYLCPCTSFIFVHAPVRFVYDLHSSSVHFVYLHSLLTSSFGCERNRIGGDWEIAAQNWNTIYFAWNREGIQQSTTGGGQGQTLGQQCSRRLGYRSITCILYSDTLVARKYNQYSSNNNNIGRSGNLNTADHPSFTTAQIAIDPTN